MSKSAEKTPMDASIRENKVGHPSGNTQRTCGAVKQLVAEVHALFPETPYEVSNYDGRNTGLDVTFDLSMMDDEALDLITLLQLLSDPRIELVDTDTSHEGVVAAMVVSMKASARTQDSRESFGLVEAYSVLGESDGSDFDSTDPAPAWALDGSS